MAKYVRPHTDVTISFSYNKKSLSIIFNMQSVHIEKSEIKDIFKEGYSGLEAKKSKKDGEGIGMYRAQVLLDLNGGTINVEPEDQYEEEWKNHVICRCGQCDNSTIVLYQRN